VIDMEIVFLGTNGWYSTALGDTVSILVKTNDCNIVFDAGNGFNKLNEYADFSRPTYLFISHFHLDHISGLHALLKFNFRKGLSIISKSGGDKFLEKFINSPFTFPLRNLPYKTKLITLPKAIKDIPFKIDFLPLVHSGGTIGFRIEEENKAITYCPDTAFCKNAVKLSKKADILITECAFRSGENREKWFHLNPELAAAIAAKAGAKKLYLTHFDACRYKTFNDRLKAQKAARKIFPKTYASKDGMRVKI